MARFAFFLVGQAARAVALASFVLLASASPDAAAPLLVQAGALPRSELVIASSNARAWRFEVEIARTPEQRSRGLMFRTELAENAGMLFVYVAEGEIMMWMKNTLIPLDMLFIAGDGRITRIAARTTPLSLETIASGGPVRAVLELAGGTAERLGIRPGDRVRTEALDGLR